MNRRISPHLWWVISILSVIIIALVAFILTDKMVGASKVMEYISYASVLLSITLSIFAIIYAYTSNVQIQQQFDKINTAANNMATTSKTLTQTGGRLNDNLDSILQMLKSIDRSQQEISAQLADVNEYTTEKNNENKMI